MTNFSPLLPKLQNYKHYPTASSHASLKIDTIAHPIGAIKLSLDGTGDLVRWDEGRRVASG